MNKMYDSLQLKNIKLPNRIIRSATFEGMATKDGRPTKDLITLYENLVAGGVGLIVTGFNYIHEQGKAMQLYQAGINSQDKVEAWKDVLSQINLKGTKVFMQISHCGRQTLSSLTGYETIAPSSVRCSYFKGRPKAMSEDDIWNVIRSYAVAAKNAKDAGFHGVQVHCAHGYLIHQFLSKNTNRRKDSWGGSLENRVRFLVEICKEIKKSCGESYPIIIKISLSDDRGHTVKDTSEILKLVESSGLVDAAELSYGTMEFALNIFRGETIPVNSVLKFNPFYKRYPVWVKKIWKATLFHLKKREFIPYCNNYNLPEARIVRGSVGLPLFLVGGIRTLEHVKDAFDAGMEAVSMSRPFIIEPDFLARIEKEKSKCINCNICAIMCDSEYITRCFSKKP